jgi:hypothetical protein
MWQELKAVRNECVRAPLAFAPRHEMEIRLHRNEQMRYSPQQHVYLHVLFFCPLQTRNAISMSGFVLCAPLSYLGIRHYPPAQEAWLRQRRSPPGRAHILSRSVLLAVANQYASPHMLEAPSHGCEDAANGDSRR